MLENGRLENLKKWSADFSGASALEIAGGSVKINLSGEYQYSTLAYCDGIFLILEGNRLSDIEALFR